MAVRRGHIDRRLSAATPIVLDRPADTIVVFRDGWGEVTKRYDSGTLGLPSDIAILLADAFRHHHAASSRETQRHCWMALRTFARFVVEDGQVLSADDLTSAMVGRYIAWLDRQVGGQTNQPWSKGSRANVLMQLRQMIDWTKRRHPSGCLPASTSLGGSGRAAMPMRDRVLAQRISRRSWARAMRKSTRRGSASKRDGPSLRRAARSMASIPSCATWSWRLRV
ncbi:hypothetical protein ILFOPFJJ_06889 [Ensifer psoraleae]|uniref:hypothetical protein n=1 Tax=Sinorhizobium psoraleae TaxID=520838 RepID=UPI001AEF2B47|nr:hypothetical protein [Sinorhizobium psoraleae]NRP75965.1 hypothetical protein [Sinorhizobium psoraleae]